jgi:hypothetical protein
MLAGDARQEWDGNSIPDSRVMHFWDGERQVGKWFAEEVDGYRGVSWDTYYLYGPEATWERIPSPLVGSGGTIVGEREQLEMQVQSLFGKSDCIRHSLAENPRLASVASTCLTDK